MHDTATSISSPGGDHQVTVNVNVTTSPAPPTTGCAAAPVLKIVGWGFLAVLALAFVAGTLTAGGDITLIFPK